jgi:hypothetical protein
MNSDDPWIAWGIGATATSNYLEGDTGKRMRRYIVAITLLAAVSIAARAGDGDIATRFGALQIGGEFGNLLSFKGHRLVRGGNRLSPVQTVRIGATEVVMVQETGGTACPALYYFVRVSASGAEATPAFGTCDEFTQVTRNGDRILVSMPGYQGPFEPAAAREKAAREGHVFTYRDGMVTEKGKPVRRSG